ncbi:DNA invertase Pin-like site-specific DNA recombinase [Sinomonas atrocyanea]|uniref:recombinase family protein n=1 Tax=Sinomonas atrocyanea TaxID=37927 RepID=UPI002784F68B|nr:recombinase family protein [Sinomonas atrocyanea]MDQ0260487.1 DNA invertase Pin-like site-specific DNA recombinase [Sinomonas atrocyanea]
MATYGYARVSTADQNPQLQIDALEAHGVDVDNPKRLYTEHVSGTVKASDRERLAALLDRVEAGDKIIVWKFDRLGRNTLDVLSVLQTLKDRGVYLESVTDKIDTSSPMGEAMFTILAAFAQLERDLIAERTTAGLQAAREQGKLGGRPKVTTRDPRVAQAVAYRKRGFTVEETAHQMSQANGKSISIATVYRLLRLGRDATQ